MTSRLPQRKSPRLKEYDYAQSGAYFVTICTHRREYLFGDVRDGAMVFTPAGRIAHEEICKISSYWQNRVDVDLFVVMPNHVHIIIVIVDTAFLPSDGKNNPLKPDVGTAFLPSDETQNTIKPDANTAFLPSDEIQNMQETDMQKHVPTLGQIVGNYKSGVTRRIRESSRQSDQIVWQTRYHDHIIRNDDDLNRIREYIINNPNRWESDSLYTPE